MIIYTIVCELCAQSLYALTLVAYFPFSYHHPSAPPFTLIAHLLSSLGLSSQHPSKHHRRVPHSMEIGTRLFEAEYV